MKKTFYKKIRSKLFRLLCEDYKLRLTPLDDGENCFITDGYEGFIFPLEKLLLNPAAFMPFTDEPDLSFLELTKEDTLLTETNDYKHMYNEFVQRFRGRKFDIYLRSSFVKDFPQCMFYASSSASRVLVINDEGNAIGVINPVRVSEDDV